MAIRSISGGTGKVRHPGRIVVGTGGSAPPPVFSTWDPTMKGTKIALSGSDLVASTTASGGATVIGTQSHNSGVHQFEVTVSGTPDFSYIGVAKSGVNLNNFLGVDTNGWGFTCQTGYRGWTVHSNSYQDPWGGVFVNGDVIGVVLDLTAGTLKFYKNGTLQGAGNAYTSLSGTFFPAWGSEYFPRSAILNVGATAFAFPISGASTWG